MNAKSFARKPFVMGSITLCLVLGFLLLSGWVALADSIALSQTVQAGKTAIFTVSVRNETGASHTYTPTLTGMPSGVAVSFRQGGPLVEKLAIPGQAATQIEVQVQTQPETPVGFYQGQFTATRDDGVALQIPVELAVENTYALQITSQALNLSTFSGQEFSFDVAVLNSGASPVTQARLQVDTPPKWVVRTDPAQVDSLAAGDSVSFRATVLVPASQIAIDQPLKMTVVSDQIASGDAKLVVRVQKSPSFLYGAALLVGVTVAGVFVYFRRQGRR